MTAFLSEVDIEYLSCLLEVENKDNLLRKVEEECGHLSAVDKSRKENCTGKKPWENQDSAIYDETVQIIRLLGLEKYRGQRNEEENPVSGTSENVGSRREENNDDDVTTTNVEPTSNEQQHCKSQSPLPLTKNEGLLRESQKNEKLQAGIMLSPHDDNCHLRELKGNSIVTSPAVPAPITISNVNVITKAELKAQGKPSDIQDTSKVRSGLRSVLRKIRESISRPDRKRRLLWNSNKAGEKNKPSSNEVIGVESSAMPQQRESRAKDSHDKNQNRRSSVVGENLPFYIKEQLTSLRESQNLNNNPWARDTEQEQRIPTIRRPKQESSITSPTTPKKQSRVQNLLANSKSLYSSWSEQPLHDSHNPESNDANLSSIGNYSEFDPDYGPDDNDDSESDKEYILPELFTKYFGSGDANQAEEEVLRSIENLDSQNDFFNLRESYGNLDDENKTNHEEENDILFKH